MRTLTLVAALCLLGACAKNRDRAATQPETLQPSSMQTGGQPVAATNDRPKPPPVVVTPDAERAGPAVPATSATNRPQASQAAAPPRALPGPEGSGADGRPEWYMREPRWSEARLTVCAEALGATVLDARRAAVQAGIDRIGALLERDASNAEIVVTTVRPLPVPAEAPGGMRFVGYVMVTARTDEGSGR